MDKLILTIFVNIDIILSTERCSRLWEVLAEAPIGLCGLQVPT